MVTSNPRQKDSRALLHSPHLVIMFLARSIATKVKASPWLLQPITARACSSAGSGEAVVLSKQIGRVAVLTLNRCVWQQSSFGPPATITSMPQSLDNILVTLVWLVVVDVVVRTHTPV